MENTFKKMREKSGLKQSDVANKLQVGQSTISMWETGDSFPRASTLLQLAKLYDCTVDDLLQDSPAPELDTA